MKLSSKLAIGYIILGVILLITSLAFNVDESQYCMGKVNQWYPDKEYISAVYISLSLGSNEEHTCIMTKLNCEDARDGLRMNCESIDDNYKLVDQEDLDYMSSDNPGWFTLSIWGFLGFIILIIYQEH